MLYKFLFILFMLVSVPAFAKLNQDDCVKTIVGEAANQGYSAMLGIADVIRNRNSLKGCYGLNNPCVNKQPQWVWKMARKAWQESATNDITNGCTHFGSRMDDGYFHKLGMKPVLVIKDTRFYK